jgi:hypothetical protein
VSRGAIWQYSFGIYFGNLLVPRLDEFDRTFTPLNAAVDRYGLRTHPSAGDDWTFKFQQIKLRHVDFSHFLIFKNKYYTRFPFLIDIYPIAIAGSGSTLRILLPWRLRDWQLAGTPWFGTFRLTISIKLLLSHCLLKSIFSTIWMKTPIETCFADWMSCTINCWRVFEHDFAGDYGERSRLEKLSN